MPASSSYTSLSASSTATLTVAGASRSDAGPSRAVSRTSPAWAGSVTPVAGPAGTILANSAVSGSADWSGRSSDTLAAWAESTAMVSELVAAWVKDATGMACRTPGSWTRVPAWAAESGWLVSTRTSAPELNAAWSWSEPVQLCRCASASVTVAVASTISRAAPPCLIGWRLICQLARAAVSRRPRAASRSPALPPAGSRRSARTVPPASASAGAITTTGSTPKVPFAPADAAE